VLQKIRQNIDKNRNINKLRTSHFFMTHFINKYTTLCKSCDYTSTGQYALLSNKTFHTKVDFLYRSIGKNKCNTEKYEKQNKSITEKQSALC